MFTPGFRLFFGFSLVSLGSAAAYGVASASSGEDEYFGFLNVESWIGVLSLGYRGSVGDHVGYVILTAFAVLSAMVAFFLVAFRDADAESVGELMADRQTPPTQQNLSYNYWPAVGAFGIGTVVVGLVTHVTITVIGLVVLGGVMFEWMLAAWADRTTADPAVNRRLRSRIMGPVEYPITAALGVAVLVLALSRLLLTVSEFTAVMVAGSIATVLFLLALVFVLVPRIGRSIVAGVVALICVGVLVAGVISASVGSRDIELHHEEHAEEVEGVEG